MARVLITGIGGFTGRYLAHELAGRGHEVHGLVRRSSMLDQWPVREADLLDRAALTETLSELCPDVVVHLAAVAFVAHGDIDSIYRTNVVGTRNLLDALVATGSGSQAVLVASSANVYGNADCELINETVVPQPVNDYAISKLAMEFAARLSADRLPITIVRPFNYTGVGQAVNFLLPKIVANFRERSAVLELGNIHVVRDFSDVRMVVRAYAELISRDFSGRTFNVCSGVGHTLKDVLDMMSGLTGHYPEIRINSAFVRTNEVHKLIGDNRCLQDAIGELDITELEDTLAWMLEDKS
ncbi:NAD-dependent epimerase/dehydratase family protein [Burkholderia gladioli]|uniref:NAD-dependent epimerase/dehydratase family protein n=1 Tax=Burkholderia gladioli TaxID=28095 RepID=UPI00264BD898|nr:NAD-dependent epimerase/dehydratase family protein [Burkholderia gladioli]MDN7718691.1 NAD-dependent epimerase/dehydratase family protein [Burkholderia gladioli]